MSPDARPASPAPSSFLTARSVIRATAWVIPRRGDPGAPYYLIVSGPDQDPEAPEQLFRTHDAALYALAAAIEGTERRVQLQWHPGQAVSSGRPLRILEAIR